MRKKMQLCNESLESFTVLSKGDFFALGSEAPPRANGPTACPKDRAVGGQLRGGVCQGVRKRTFSKH